MINAGKYNEKISIYSIVNEEDDAGFKIQTKSIILNTYANVKTTKGFTLLVNNTDMSLLFPYFNIRF